MSIRKMVCGCGTEHRRAEYGKRYEYGTLPKIESAEMMFSASRSRRLQIVPII